MIRARGKDFLNKQIKSIQIPRFIFNKNYNRRIKKALII